MGLISGHLENLGDERFGLGDTLFTMAIGPVGWLVHVGIVTAAASWLWRQHRSLAAGSA